MTGDQVDSAGKESGSGWKRSYIDLKNEGFFSYLGHSLVVILLAYILLIFLIFLLGKYLIDFEAFFGGIIERLSDRLVILLFFASESFTGMIPVDLFVIWTQKFDSPLPWLALLGILSYTGGMISYGIGLWIARRPRIKAFTERRLRGYIAFVRKWGGAFIVIAALFPFTPFSLVVIALTLFHYPFRNFLVFGLSRLLRFVLQGIIFFDLLKLDNWII